MNITDVILSEKNINDISVICKSFIQQNYNISLEYSTLQTILRNILIKHINYYNHNPPIPPVEELNKRAIGEVRNFVLEQKQGKPLPQPQLLQQQLPQPQPQLLQQQLPQQQLPQQQLPQQQQPLPQQYVPPQLPQQQISQQQLPQPQSQPQLPQPQPQQLVPPQLSSSSYKYEYEYESDQPRTELLNEKSEDDFMKKLQILEMQRQENITMQKPAEDPVPKDTNKMPTQVPAQPTNTIIYMNSSSTNQDLRNIKPIVLHGSNRMWLHIQERNILTFNGPLPDSTQIRLSQVLLPKRISRNTPCINVCIKSATDKVTDILCHIDKEGSIWDIWKPVSHVFSYIKTFACPWTILLQDIFNTPLAMGKDAIKIINVKQLVNENTKIIVERNIDLESYGQILVQLINTEGENRIEKINTLHVYDNQIELDGNYSWIKADNSDIYICNLQAQAYIIFEMEKISDNDSNK